MAAELAIIAKLQDEASSGIRALRGEVEGLGTSGETAGRGFSSLQAAGTVALAAIATAAAAAGAAIIGFVASSVSKAAELEAQMDTVAALLGATADQAELLRQATLDLALDPNLSVSATEAAQAIEMLAQNGLTVEQILGGAAEATVQLANATGADFTTAARIATDAMALWGMEADQLGQVADGVTAVLVQSKFEVNDYALALAQAGGVAAAVGVSFEDFNATLVAIAPYFASGSDAGTSYKTMLQRLIPTTTAAKDAMAALGMITEDGANAFFNADGSMKDMAEVAGILNNALSGLSEQQRLQALSTIFGTDAMRAAAAMSQFTEEEFRNLMAVMANTSAAEIAAQRMQNFSGAMDILKGVIEGLQIMLGNVLLPILTQMALAGSNLLAAYGPPLIAAFERLVAIFSEFFTSIQSGMTVWEALRTALSEIGQLFGMTAAEASTFAAGVASVVQAIASFVSWKDVLAAVGIAIASVVIPALIAIVQFLAPIIATVAAVILAVAALRNAWESDFLGIRTAVEGLFETFGRFVEAIRVLTGEGVSIQAMVDALASLPEALRPLAEAVAAFINTLRDGGSLVDAFRAGLETLKQAIFDWAGASNWADVGRMILDKIAEAFSNLGDRAATTAANILNWISTSVNSIDWHAVGSAIVNGIAAAIAGVVGLLVTAGTAISNFFTSFFTSDKLQAAGQNIVTALGNAISGLSSGISSGLESIRQAILNWAGVASWSEVGGVILDRIAETFRNLGDRAAQMRADLFNWIADAVNGIEWREVGEKIIDGIVAAITAVIGLLVAAGTAIVNYFVGFFTNDELAPAAGNLITSLGNAIGELAGGIGDGLAKVRDAIFAWAGVEDWSGVAQKIIEMVGTALGTAAAAISAQLGEWQQAIFDWAGTEDWLGVAQHIADMIGEKLGEVKDAITEKLGEWQQAIFDWAGTEDWEGVANHIAELIGVKLGEAKETLASKLSEWRQAIWDWADTEDWQGVADHIAELVATDLGESSDTVTSNLSSWQQAMFDWAGTEDWNEVSAKMAEMIGDGLAGEAESVTEKMSGWVGEFTAWVEKTDFKQVGHDIMFKVTDAFLDFQTAVQTKIATWQADLKAATDKYTWQEIGAYILMKIVEALSGKGGGEGGGEAANWDMVIATWVAEISNAIIRAQASLSQLGQDIVAGIAAGITAATDFLRGAITGVIDAARGAGEQRAGAHSPATEFMPLGNDISAGVAVGMTQGTGLVVDAIQQLAGQIEVEGAKAFGEAMKALAEGLAAGMNAILDLSAFPGVGGSFLDNLRSVVEMLGQMVAEVNQANTYGAEALERLGVFVDVAGGIADLILPLIVALTEIGRFQPPSAETFTAALAQLAVYLSMTVQHVAAANQYSTLVLEGLSAFLDVMEQIADTVGPFLAALVDINAFGTVDLWFFHEGIAQLWYTMLLVAQAVQELAILGTETLARMEGFLDVIEAMADTIGPFIEALYELNAFGTVDLNFFHEGLAQLAYVMLMVVGALNEANTFGTAALEAVQLFAETAGAIAEMIGPMIEGLISINALDGTMNEVAYHAVYFRNGVRALVDALASAAQLFTSGTLQHVQLFAETAGAIAEIIVPAVEGLMIIGTLTGDLNYIGIQATYFRNGLRTIVSALESAAELFTAAILNQIQLFAETAGKIMEIVAAAIEGFALIATLTGEVNYLGIQATYLRNGLRIIVSAISSAAELFTAGLLAHTQLFAETAGEIVDLIADAIEALALLASYVAAAGLEAAAAAFAVSLTTVVTTIVNALESAGLLTNEAIVQAGELADGLGDVLGLVEDGVEALVALASYVPAANLVPTAQQFAADLATVITTVVNALQLAGILASTAIVAAGELADGLADVLGMVEDGVSALVELANYVPNAGLVALAQRFAVDLAAVITAVVNALVQAGLLANQAVVEAGELADGLADILSVVADGVEAITALTAYVATSGIQEKAAAFAADLATVINAIVNGLVTAGLLANQAVAAAGELAGKLSDLLGVVADGIEALQALAEYQGVDGLKDKVQIFTSDLITVASLLATQLTLAANTIGAATIDAARAFAAGVTALATEVQAAMTALGQLAGIATPNLVPVLNYIVTAADQLRVAFTVAGDIGQAVAYAAAFRANLEQLVQEVQAAAAQLNALAGVGTTGSIGAALANIAASLQNTEGQFTGAGAALAGALIDALTGGISAGQGDVMGAATGVLDATRAAGESAARGFDSVGDAIIDAIAAAVESGQNQLIASVTQVVNAAIAAGVAAARAADSIGQQLVQAAVTEVNNGRNQLDSAGSAAGNALIDGMARAILAGKSRLVNAIKDAVASAVAAAKAALGIASPSRVAIELLSNFMNTAANTVDSLRGRLADSVASAVAGAAAAATANMNAIRLAPQLTPALAFPGSALADRVAAAPAGRAGGRWAGSEGGGSTQVVFYGNVVLPNVVDSRSFLEELDALRGAA